MKKYLVVLIFGLLNFSSFADGPLNTFEQAENYLKREVIPNRANWFEDYVTLPKMDGVYRDVAEQLGGLAIIGGSDLSDVILGEGVKISSTEMNVLHPASSKLLEKLSEVSDNPKEWGDAVDKYVDPDGIMARNRSQEQKELIQAERQKRSTILKEVFPDSKPTWFMGNPDNGFSNAMVDLNHGSIPERAEIIVNFGEMNKEYEIYRANYEKGLPVSNGTYGLWSSLKSRYLLLVDKSGEARLYFRTPQAKLDWQKKIMRLPDEHLLSVDPLKGVRESYKLFSQIKYNIALLARGRKDGWKYSDKSKKIIRQWSNRVMEDPETHTSFKWNISQEMDSLLDQVPREDIEWAMKEFNFAFVDGVTSSGFSAGVNNQAQMEKLAKRKRRILNSQDSTGCLELINAFLIQAH